MSDAQDFERLRTKWSTAWQQTVASDDGSLSIRYGERRYVNVETERGKSELQFQMLSDVLAKLGAPVPTSGGPVPRPGG